MKAIPGIIFDWVIEERFQFIPKWHPAVDQVFPISLRKWKKNKKFFSSLSSIMAFKKKINETEYDLVLDAQGLLKSAIITSLLKAPSAGYKINCIREKCASFFYKKKYFVEWNQHAVERIRYLFSQALYYPKPEFMPDYGIDKSTWFQPLVKPYIIFFHGTTWANKHWPENYWKSLLKLLNQRQFNIKLAWGNQEEYARSQRIAEYGKAEILPDLNIEELMPIIANAAAVIGVDTGLSHLASALNIPSIALFGPTHADKVGLMGEKQLNLVADFPCAPCLKRKCHFSGKTEEWPACMMTLTPTFVMKKLIEMKI
jgi:heptosyltransferase-1